LTAPTSFGLSSTRPNKQASRTTRAPFVHRPVRSRSTPILVSLRSRPSVVDPSTRRCLPQARRGDHPLTLHERGRRCHLLRGADLRPRLVKDAGFARRRSAFFRRVLARRSDRTCRPNCLEREPAIAVRLCHLTATSDAPFARSRWEPARLHALDPLITGRASQPHAARRRLPSADPQALTNGPRSPPVGVSLLGLRRATPLRSWRLR